MPQTTLVAFVLRDHAAAGGDDVGARPLRPVVAHAGEDQRQDGAAPDPAAEENRGSTAGLQ